MKHKTALSIAILASMSGLGTGITPKLNVQATPCSKTKYDLEALEKARLKQERKAAKKNKKL